MPELLQFCSSCFTKAVSARPARRFGSDALNYAVGLAQGYKSCEREALAQMMDLLAKCAASRMHLLIVARCSWRCQDPVRHHD